MHDHLASLAPEVVHSAGPRVFDSASFASAKDSANKRNHGRR